MSITAIQNEVLNLPVDERLRMIELLWNSVTEPEIKAREGVWAAESERRVDAFDAGSLTARDASAVFGDMKKRLPK